MLNPRHILITGASSGIGAALTQHYAAAGVCLSLHGRNAERLGAVAEQARRKGAEVAIHSGDVCDASDMATWVAGCAARMPIDLVIANAGISGGTFSKGGGGESAEQIAAIFATNVTGVFNTVHPTIEVMKKQGNGQIAIVSSVAGFRGFAGATAYCASKAAVRVFGEGLRAELAPLNIAVNVVCPGFIRTPMTDTNPFPMPFILTPERAARIIARGLAANKGRIAFPLPVYIMARIMAGLPQIVADKIAALLPRK